MAAQEHERSQSRPKRIVENTNISPDTTLIEALSGGIDQDAVYLGGANNSDSHHHYLREQIQHFRDRLHPPKRKTPQEEIDLRLRQMLKERRKVKAGEFIDTIKRETDFKELDPDLVVAADPIGMSYPDRRGKRIPYMERLKAAEKASGLKEAVSYGDAKIDGRDVEIAFVDMRFLGGSFGRVAGEKIMRAIDRAMGVRHVSDNDSKKTVIDNEFTDESYEHLDKKQQKPLVIVWNTGGARQQEGFEALTAMPDIVAAIHEFKEKTDQPYISVLVGDVFGGASASGVLLGDFVVARKDSNMGFAGERVMGPGEEVKPGDQSVEVHMLETRQIDVILENEEEVLEYCGQALRILDKDEWSQSPQPDSVQVYEVDKRQNKSGFFTDFPKQQRRARRARRGETVFSDQKGDKDMYAAFNRLVTSAKRPDTSYLIKSWFGDNYIPLSSECVLPDGYRIRPAITAAYGRGPDGGLYLVVGHNPTEVSRGDMSYRLSTSPTPDDFVFVRRKLEQAQRFDEDITIISVIDTPGSKATIGTEKQRVALEIALNTKAAWDIKRMFITVVNGVFGSGGGIATAWFDKLATEESQLYVADPNATANIISEPTPQAVREIIETSAVTPEQQMHMGNIDGIIPLPPGGSDQNPIGLAKNILHAIMQRKKVIKRELKAFGEIPQEIAIDKRRQQKQRRRRHRAGIPLKNA